MRLPCTNLFAFVAFLCIPIVSATNAASTAASSPMDVPTGFYAVHVNPGAPRQVFDGWGVSLCWWANMCGHWPEEKIDSIVDLLVLPENLNYNIFRYNIGGGDDPDNSHCAKHHMGNGKGLRAEMPGFKIREQSEYDWKADEPQIKIMRKIKEKRPDAIFEAFSNSAPWWMTFSGCCAGAVDAASDNLKPEYYDAFADYLIDVMLHIKEVEGIEFTSIAPFNEPYTNFWGCGGSQEGCHFDMQSMADFINLFYPKLKASGLNTVISACDETSVGTQIDEVRHFDQSGVLSHVGRINTHTYQGDVIDCCRLSALCSDKDIPLWMSETGAGGKGIHGNLNMARRLIRDMRYLEPAAWCDWQYIEEPNDQWCLLQGDFAKGTFRLTNNYFVRRHFSHFIKPGYTIITSTDDKTLAAVNPDRSELVLVIINPDSIQGAYSIDLGLFDKIGTPITALYSGDGSYNNNLAYSIVDSYLSFNLDGLSIATFIIPAQSALQSGLINGGEYYIYPRRTASGVITAEKDGLYLQRAGLLSNQIWKADMEDGNVRFTNRDGRSILYNNETGAFYPSETDTCTSLSVSPVGFRYYKIEAGGKAIELEGDDPSIGTRIVGGDYGTENTESTHRQWRFLPIGKRSNVTYFPAL